MSIEVYEINAFLFLLGGILFIIGALLNIRFWFLGTDSIFKTIKKGLKIVFSRKMFRMIKALIVYLITMKKLGKSSFFRRLEKTIFIIFYGAIILVSHFYAEYLSLVYLGHKISIISFIENFLYSPFIPAYVFTFESWQEIKWLKEVLFIDNLCMVMIVFFAEILLLIRRYFEKYFVISKPRDKFLIVIPVLWLTMRFFGEAASIIYFNIPKEYASCMFVSYLLSYLLYPLSQMVGAYTLYYVFWLLSGIAFMIFVAVWPYTKLWHAFSGSLTILINFAEGEQYD